MSYGLLALLDDIAALAKMAAASVDDIAAQSLRSGSQSLGIVIDDAAVTPQFVSGVSPARELPAIFRIARWSLFNKIVVITPLALLLSAFLPVLVTPLLMIGGLYLAFEGAEKVLEWLGLLGHHEPEGETTQTSPAEAEATTVSGAVRTDFILSCEIMVLTLSGVADQPLAMQLGVMVAIAVAFTLGVYGLVALIVRIDDIGLGLARRHGAAPLGRFGCRLVASVAPFLTALGVVGTLAMLWVGGSILIHGLAVFSVTAPEHLIAEIAERLTHAIGPGVVADAASWGVAALFSAVLAFLLGTAAAVVFAGVKRASG